MPVKARFQLPDDRRLTLAPDEAAVVEVSLDDHCYAIRVGPGLLDRVGELCPANGARGLVVASETVAALYSQRCLQSLRGYGWQVELVTVPDGEGAKTLAQAGALYEACVAGGLDRGGTLFALGGGVIGDLTGFVAATYMRGIAFVQIPTTLLAQVDASVGGKTAVDLPAGKNLVGAFHQPSLVVIDVDTLRTLPRRDVCAGMAEVIKHAAIADAAMFEFLRRSNTEALLNDPGAMRQLVARNCQIKAEVVVADPKERGVRACLNFGHTVGHAIEAAAGEWDLRHGEAVALGMIAEARLAARLGYAGDDVAAGLATVLRQYDQALGVPQFDVGRARQALLHDKKIAAGQLRLPVVPRLGECTLRDDVPVSALVQSLEEVAAG